jgi:DNA-binding Lrp family transcriptional regulator|tara:strand:- start:34 stop:498 length:465 start_codon:yes stop_codon:yes gene_type:complete
LHHALDDIDRKILRLIQRDCKQTSAEIAEKVGLSQTPCLRRIRNMESAGVIERYTAILNPDCIGLGMTFFTRVWLTGQDEATVKPFTKAVRLLSNVVECHLMAGDCDFLLRVLAADIPAYRRFQIEHLNALPGVQSVKTEIPMQRIKYSTEIPI